jgi:hypothetical protein
MDMDDSEREREREREADREREAYLLGYYRDLVQTTAEVRMIGRLFVARFKLRRKQPLAKRDRLFLEVLASLTPAHAHARTHTRTHTHAFATCMTHVHTHTHTHARFARLQT